MSPLEHTLAEAWAQGLGFAEDYPAVQRLAQDWVALRAKVEGLEAAVREINELETQWANATTRKMARVARSVLNAEPSCDL